MRPDADLQQRVLRNLADSPDVDQTAVGVSAHHGVVTLTGAVSSYAEKHAAERVAHAVPGVLDVANDLEVRPGWQRRPSDTDIAEAVRNALAGERRIRHEWIRTTVEGRGHVRLEGIAANPREREFAENAVRALEGVELVTNLIEIDTTAAGAH